MAVLLVPAHQGWHFCYHQLKYQSVCGQDLASAPWLRLLGRNRQLSRSQIFLFLTSTEKSSVLNLSYTKIL
jgi:hypothetical protein